MFSNSVIFWLTINCAFVHAVIAIECLSTDKDNYKCHLGSTTPYRFIANHDDSQLNYTGCKAAKIWLLIRHGTRLPGKKLIGPMTRVLPELKRNIIKHYRNGESKVMSNHIEELIRWMPHSMVTGDEKKLTEEGEKELIDIAETFQSRFPDLLPEIYSNETYKFKYTNTQRAEESARHFALGLFGRRGSQQVWYPPPEKPDLILRSYKNCDRWQAEVKRNAASKEQMNLFVTSKTFDQTLDEISNRLGFKIDHDTASLLYSACAYETAWTEDTESPWCNFLSLENFKVRIVAFLGPEDRACVEAFFKDTIELCKNTKKEIRSALFCIAMIYKIVEYYQNFVLEYAEDLEIYWIDGYGFPFTNKQALPTLRDMFHFFESVSDRKAAVYFSHSGMILKLLSLLGIAKDATPLTHDSFELHRDNRSWRASRIDAFATNLGFVLYECEKQGPGVLVLHQERVTQIPGCPENVPCPISVLQELFSQGINNYNFTEMCKL